MGGNVKGLMRLGRGAVYDRGKEGRKGALCSRG